MAATRTTKKRGEDTTLSALSLDGVKAGVDRLRQDVEDTVESIGKRAMEVLPEGQREQVDELMDRLNDVRDDMNKTVDTWRTDIERRFDIIRGTVDKRVGQVRKETEVRSKKIVTGLEKDLRVYVNQVFKRLQLPVRSDVSAIKRRLTAIERRLEALEKSREKSRGKRAAA